jgi:hypothetical protein
MFHSYFQLDDGGGPVAVVHECEAHARVSRGILCGCGDCWEQTPCNCPRTHPCMFCAAGEPPEESALRAIAVVHAFSEDHR